MNTRRTLAAEIGDIAVIRIAEQVQYYDSTSQRELRYELHFYLIGRVSKVTSRGSIIEARVRFKTYHIDKVDKIWSEPISRFNARRINNIFMSHPPGKFYRLNQVKFWLDCYRQHSKGEKWPTRPLPQIMDSPFTSMAS